MNDDVPVFATKSAAIPAPDYVRAGEEVVWLGRPTLALLVSQGLGLTTSFVFLGLFFTSFAARAGNTGMGMVGVAVVILFIVLLILQAMRIQRTQYVVTRQSIYTRIGIVGQTVVQTTFDKITDISLKQDVLGRVLGFSSLHVNTAGSGTPPVRMDGLRNALQMKGLIEAAREQFLRRPEREQAPARPARPVPRFIPDRLLLRLTCTTTRKPFKRPRTELGKMAPCPHCGKTHLVKEAVRGESRTA